MNLASAACPKPWVCEDLNYLIPTTDMTGSWSKTPAKIRAGYYPETGAFKGNVIYFEGLGDSMINHGLLFSKLSQAGLRVIAFDYMGQGGSTGKMNNTRINVISKIGNVVWKHFARDQKNYPQKSIIGWSTGGLAAYLAASRNEVDKVVLIAPGIVPNMIVGGGLFGLPPDEITIETLTTENFSAAEDPHKDVIKPNSPIKVPLFAFDLMSRASSAQKIKIPARVKGLVLLSGKDDTYVNAEKTRVVLKANAPHFKVKSYAGALHEIDNEIRSIRDAAHQEILNFLLN